MDLSLALNLLGALGVFLYGLKVMSEGLQKAAGDRLRAILAKATNNPVSGTISGFLVTCLVQSSSATTVMVVGFASAGLLTLGQSLGVIFGANIGTTTTGWLVSLLGFKVKIAKFALPIIGIGFFSQFIRGWRWPRKIGEALVGFGLLFLGLSLLKEAIPDVKQAPEVMEILSSFSADTMGGRLIVVGIGAILTMIFQSSSAMMAVTLTAAAKGLIGFPTAAALVLGENIGTTITANLAAIGAPLTARRAARAHMVFNVLGVTWALILFTPFLKFLDSALPGDPYGTSEASLLIAIPTTIAAFHSIFNITNTVVMLPFTRVLERFIIWLVPEKKSREEKEHDLLFLNTPFAGTPELAIPAAQKEVDRMAGITVRMADKIRKAIEADKEKLPAILQSIKKDETTTDVLEAKINGYLARVTHQHLSSAATKEALSLLSMINDLERIGDHGEKVAVLLQRESDGSLQFSNDARDELREISKAAHGVLSEMKKQILHRADDLLPRALEREEALDALRDKFRKAHLRRLADGKCDALAGLVFSDLLGSFEKMGDHAFNVVEACAGVK